MSRWLICPRKDPHQSGTREEVIGLFRDDRQLGGGFALLDRKGRFHASYAIADDHDSHESPPRLIRSIRRERYASRDRLLQLDCTNAGKAEEPLPIIVLTGFLGSGKTTLLRALLSHPQFARTAVLVNELGEIGIDHLLVKHVTEELVLLESGCLCCTLRGDLVEQLGLMWERRERGDVPAFARVVIETTGLADPAPILATLLAPSLVKRTLLRRRHRVHRRWRAWAHIPRAL